jgi:hypothetical protein
LLVRGIAKQRTIMKGSRDERRERRMQIGHAARFSTDRRENSPGSTPRLSRDRS